MAEGLISKTTRMQEGHKALKSVFILFYFILLFILKSLSRSYKNYPKVWGICFTCQSPDFIPETSVWKRSLLHWKVDPWLEWEIALQYKVSPKSYLGFAGLLLRKEFQEETNSIQFEILYHQSNARYLVLGAWKNGMDCRQMICTLPYSRRAGTKIHVLQKTKGR